MDREESVEDIGADSYGQPIKGRPVGHDTDMGQSAYMLKTDQVVAMAPIKDGPGPAASMPATSPAPGAIRPLALAPDPQPITMVVPPPASMPMALGNAVGSGIKGLASPSGVQSPVTILPKSTNPAQAGYIATGGGSSTNHLAEANFAGGGGSTSGAFTGTTSAMGTSATRSAGGGTSPGNTAGGTTSTPGNFSLVPTSGGTSIPGTLKVLQTAPSGGGPYIGSAAGFQVNSSITWTVPTPAYSTNTFVTPSHDWQWNHPDYTPPSPADADGSISFNWGETPGFKTIVATATITKTGYKPATTTATIKVNVRDPQETDSWSFWHLPHIFTFGPSVSSFRYAKLQSSSISKG